MDRVIAVSELTRNTGRYQMFARRHRVAVISHGGTTGYFIASEDYEAFERFKESRRNVAALDLSKKKAVAVSASHMDERHAHLDAILDE